MRTSRDIHTAITTLGNQSTGPAYINSSVGYQRGYAPPPGVQGGRGYRPGYRPGYGWRDRDGDGVPDRVDRDRDGDGVHTRRDARPNNPYQR